MARRKKKSLIEFVECPVFKSEEPTVEVPDVVPPEEEEVREDDIEAGSDDTPQLGYSIYRMPLGTTEDGYKLLIGLGALLVVLFMLVAVISSYKSGSGTIEPFEPEIQINDETGERSLAVSGLTDFKLSCVVEGVLEPVEVDVVDGAVAIPQDFDSPVIIVARKGSNTVFGIITPSEDDGVSPSLNYSGLTKAISDKVSQITDAKKGMVLLSLRSVYLELANSGKNASECVDAVVSKSRAALGFDNPEAAECEESAWYEVLGSDGVVDQWLKNNGVEVTDDNVRAIFKAIAEGFK